MDQRPSNLALNVQNPGGNLAATGLLAARAARVCPAFSQPNEQQNSANRHTQMVPQYYKLALGVIEECTPSCQRPQHGCKCDAHETLSARATNAADGLCSPVLPLLALLALSRQDGHGWGWGPIAQTEQQNHISHDNHEFV